MVIFKTLYQISLDWAAATHAYFRCQLSAFQIQAHLFERINGELPRQGRLEGVPGG